MLYAFYQWLRTRPPNFSKVTPTIYRRSQPSASDLVELRDKYGVQAVLNLRADATPQHRADAEAAGLLWYNVPMKDDAEPTPNQVKEALKILRSGVTVVMSCKGNRHRAGVIAAVYRVVEQGWTKEKAWKEAISRGWYDFGGHRPLRLWFEDQFKPEDY